MKLFGKLICWWDGRHLHGSPAFELPPTDKTNREINDALCIMKCPRCGGHYMRVWT